MPLRQSRLTRPLCVPHRPGDRGHSRRSPDSGDLITSNRAESLDRRRCRASSESSTAISSIGRRYFSQITAAEYGPSPSVSRCGSSNWTRYSRMIRLSDDGTLMALILRSMVWYGSPIIGSMTPKGSAGHGPGHSGSLTTLTLRPGLSADWSEGTSSLIRSIVPAGIPEMPRLSAPNRRTGAGVGLAECWYFVSPSGADRSDRSLLPSADSLEVHSRFTKAHPIGSSAHGGIFKLQIVVFPEAHLTDFPRPRWAFAQSQESAARTGMLLS
jgi:hypothetical protein